MERFGEYVSLTFEEREYTNLEQQRAASRFAHALARLRVAEGDRVVVMLPNCPEVLQAYAGILKAGAVIVPVVFLLAADDVVAYVVANAGATLDPESVIAFCRERLAGYKCPKDVRLVEALPKSPIGKIVRKELRARVD